MAAAGRLQHRWAWRASASQRRALPCGKVLVAGGPKAGTGETAELWDPATGAWSDLPPMTHSRFCASGCVLPSGRVAVVGGRDTAAGVVGSAHRREAEAFDPEARTWQQLPPMAHARAEPAVVAVPGGLLAVAAEILDGDEPKPNELFDEASGRWFTLPHVMAERRLSTELVSLPAAALAAPAPGTAGGAAAAAAQ